MFSDPPSKNKKQRSVKFLKFRWQFCVKSSPFKVEKISEDSLDSIPSSSSQLKVQIIGGKVYLR